MHFWLRIASGIDRTNEWIGRLVYWLTLVMVLIGAYNALVRWLDRYTGLGLSSNMYIELQWYLFSLVFLLGAAYTLKHNAHVRVDVLFARLTPRGRAWVNLLGTLLFLIPFCILVLWTSWPAVRNSWIVGEVSPDPGGLPRYPIKAAIPLAFILLMFQGFSLAIKQVAVLRGDLTRDVFSGAGDQADPGIGRDLEREGSEAGRPSADAGGRPAGGAAGKRDSSGHEPPGPTSGLSDDESDDGIPGTGI